MGSPWRSINGGMVPTTHHLPPPASALDRPKRPCNRIASPLQRCLDATPFVRTAPSSGCQPRDLCGPHRSTPLTRQPVRSIHVSGGRRGSRGCGGSLLVRRRGNFLSTGGDGRGRYCRALTSRSASGTKPKGPSRGRVRLAVISRSSRSPRPGEGPRALNARAFVLSSSSRARGATSSSPVPSGRFRQAHQGGSDDTERARTND